MGGSQGEEDLWLGQGEPILCEWKLARVRGTWCQCACT